MYKSVLFFNVFFSENSLAIFTRFHMVPFVERVLRIYSNGSVPLNKLAAIFGKNT